MNDKIEVAHVEEHKADTEATGATIELLRDGNVVLQPPPTADPNGELASVISTRRYSVS